MGQFGRLSFDHGYYADGRPTLLQRQAGRHPFECRSADDPDRYGSPDRKRADEIAAELGLPTSQLLGLFNKTVRKLSQYLNSVVEKEVGAQLDSASAKKAINFSKPLTEDLMDELDEEAQKLKLQEDKRSKLKEEQKKWQEDDLAQFAIKGDEQEWTKSLAKNPKGVVSVKIGEKRRLNEVDQEKGDADDKPEKKGNKKKKTKKTPSRS